MKFFHFHLMPWRYLPADFAEKNDSAWVWCPAQAVWFSRRFDERGGQRVERGGRGGYGLGSEPGANPSSGPRFGERPPRVPVSRGTSSAPGSLPTSRSRSS